MRTGSLHIFILALSLLVTMTTLVTGCSSSRLQTATRPAQPSSVNALTDSIRLEQLPPVPLPGVPTEPMRVTRYDSLDAPAADVQRVTYSPDTGLSVLLASGAEMTYKPPAHGETLDVIATSDSTARAQVRGAPQAEEVEVIAPEPRPSFWDRVTGEVTRLLAAVGVLAVIAVIIRTLTK